MDRRQALGRLGGAALAAACVGPAGAVPEGTRYEVVTEIDFARKDVPASLFIPVFESVGAWQSAGAVRIACDRPARIVKDRRYGAAMARVDFGEGEGTRRLRIAQTVTTRDRTLQPARLSAEERVFWTAALPSLPVDGIVLDTARKAAAGAATPRAKARAIYDWVVDNTFRDGAVRGCGIGGVEAMLRTGYLGGKCADINGLMVALCRAAGLPARDVYGVRIGPSRILPCLGLKSSDATRGQHCRAEVHIAGEGWLPVDPADVRKVVLETKAPVDSDLVRAQRERLFGAWEMNWAAYNSATDLDPPGAPRAPAEHFLMYPMALWPEGEADQLDPDAFRYSIHAAAL